MDIPDEERKERVLHTRVPESLDRHLKHRARRLGMSVSTVVRHVLLNTFGLVEDIVNDSADVALALTGNDTDAATAPRPRATLVTAESERRGEIVAWQDAVLNLNAVCRHCNVVLRKGTRAAVGIGDQPGPRTIICPPCLERIQQDPPRLADRKSRR
jgi:hypothetical protein